MEDKSVCSIDIVYSGATTRFETLAESFLIKFIYLFNLLQFNGLSCKQTRNKTYEKRTIT